MASTTLVTRLREIQREQRRRWRTAGLLEDASRRRVCGVAVYALTEDASFVPLYFAKVRRALECIKRCDSKRYWRLRKDVRRIVVNPFEGNHYDPQFHAIVLNWNQIVSKNAERNALTLIHEATHARIDKGGVPYTRELRGRIEAACVAQEVAFCRHLPAAEELKGELIRRLETPWWTDEKLLERELRALKDMGAPEWIVRGLGRLSHWRLRRISRASGRPNTG